MEIQLEKAAAMTGQWLASLLKMSLVHRGFSNILNKSNTGRKWIKERKL